MDGNDSNVTSTENLTISQVGSVEDSEWIKAGIEALAGAEDVEVKVETKVKEEEGKEGGGEETATEEGEETEGKEGEEPAEEDKEKELTPVEKEYAEFQVKAEKKLSSLTKKLKNEGVKVAQLEAELGALKGEGIHDARELAVALKNRDMGTVFKKFGLDMSHALQYFGPFLDDPQYGGKPGTAEQVEKNHKMKELKEKEERIEADRQALAMDQNRQIVKTVVGKFADKAILTATIGDPDHIIATIVRLHKAQDPLLVGCDTVEKAARAVLPLIEKELRKKYAPVAQAFSRFQDSSSKSKGSDGKESSSPNGKASTKDKGDNKKSSSQKDVVKEKALPKKPAPKSGGVTGSRVIKPESERTPQDWVAEGLRAFQASGK